MFNIGDTTIEFTTILHNKMFIAVKVSGGYFATGEITLTEPEKDQVDMYLKFITALGPESVIETEFKHSNIANLQGFLFMDLGDHFFNVADYIEKEINKVKNKIEKKRMEDILKNLDTKGGMAVN